MIYRHVPSYGERRGMSPAYECEEHRMEEQRIDGVFDGLYRCARCKNLFQEHDDERNRSPEWWRKRHEEFQAAMERNKNGVVVTGVGEVRGFYETVLTPIEGGLRVVSPLGPDESSEQKDKKST